MVIYPAGVYKCKSRDNMKIVAVTQLVCKYKHMKVGRICKNGSDHIKVLDYGTFSPP